MDGKVSSAVIVVVRNENRYLIEWIRYHLGIGFDHVFVCDNNFEGEEDVLTFLDSQLDSDTRSKVTVFDHRNDHRAYRQMFFYTQHIWQHKDEYTWIACIDTDEFITLADGSGFSNVNDFLSQEMFANAGQILLNWKVYGDSDLVVPDFTKGVLERFTVPVEFFNEDLNKNQNWHVKAIINCHLLKQPPRFPCPHCAYSLNAVAPNGVPCATAPKHKPDFTVAYIRHYFTKTIVEFLDRKLPGGRADTENTGKVTISTLSNWIKMFSEINRMTDEKKNIVISFLSEHYTMDEIMRAMQSGILI